MIILKNRAPSGCTCLVGFNIQCIQGSVEYLRFRKSWPSVARAYYHIETAFQHWENLSNTVPLRRVINPDIGHNTSFYSLRGKKLEREKMSSINQYRTQYISRLYGKLWYAPVIQTNFHTISLERGSSIKGIIINLHLPYLITEFLSCQWWRRRQVLTDCLLFTLRFCNLQLCKHL